MSNHTPEPWSLLEAGDSIKHQVPVSSDRTSILTIATEGAIAFGAVYSADDARRIVACVNFCACVSTENLETNEPLLWLAEQYNTVKAQRDELLKVTADHDRLVRELDVLLNGEEGAAQQASLCDLVSQLKTKGGAA